MKSVAIDDPFFQGEALLLVEDPLTATVLGGCWRMRDSSALKIVVRAVGGRDSVIRLVQAAREQKKSAVFGFVDRDFGSVRTGPDVFSTDRHEIENELLDSAVIADLSGQSESQVDAVLQAEAQRLVDWMAVRYLLTTQFSAQAQFPAVPAIADANATWVGAAAQRYYDALRESATSQTPSAWRDAWSITHRRRAEDQRVSGAWRTEFAGKELFKALVGTVTARRFSGSTEDRARAIAARWRTQPAVGSGVPACIQRVRDHIVNQCKL